MATPRRTKSKKKNLLGDTDGSVIVEASLVMPLLIYLIAGISEYGLTLYQFHTLSTANSSAVRQLVVSRGFDKPFKSLLDQFTLWAPNLSVTSSQITVSVADSGGTMKTCTDDATCKTALDSAAGRAASISINYSCALTFIPKYASPCPIQITNTGLVE